MNALIVKEPWVSLILDGKKTWEIRGSRTQIRGTIALIKSGTGKVLGTVELVDSKELTPEEYASNQDKHCVPVESFASMPYKRTHAWVLVNPVRYKEPQPYKHPQGAVIWVNLS